MSTHTTMPTFETIGHNYKRRQEGQYAKGMSDEQAGLLCIETALLGQDLTQTKTPGHYGVTYRSIDDVADQLAARHVVPKKWAYDVAEWTVHRKLPNSRWERYQRSYTLLPETPDLGRDERVA